MGALVVYESMWGNTAAVARAVAEGLGEGTTVAEVASVPGDIAVDLDLLVVGAPTHAFSLSRPTTRRDAVEKGASTRDTEHGLREWLEMLPPSDRLSLATFDTRAAQVRHLPGSAAKKAAREVRRHHLGRLVDTQSFYVADVAGPLLDGELDRAREWGAHLISHSRVHW